MIHRLLAAIVLCLVAMSAPVQAHEIRPALSQITVAHSITLVALATFGYGPASASGRGADRAEHPAGGARAINLRRGGTSLTIHRPWSVAFAFGLLHGFGFAGGPRRSVCRRETCPLHFCSSLSLSNWVGRRSSRLALVALPRRAVAIPKAAPTGTAYGLGALPTFFVVAGLEVLST